MPNNYNEYQLAEINVARMKGVGLNDPIMKEFVDNLEKVNELAEKSPGFVWRLQDENNDATSFNPYNDEQVIINVSVWESIAHLEDFVYKTFHTEFLRKRKAWFQSYGKVYTAMWWIHKGDFPTVKAAVDKLELLQNIGPTKDAFNFRTPFLKPIKA